MDKVTENNLKFESMLRDMQNIETKYIFGEYSYDFVVKKLDDFNSTLSLSNEVDLEKYKYSLIEMYVRVENLSNLIAFENDVFETVKDFCDKTSTFHYSQDEENVNIQPLDKINYSNTDSNKYLKCKRANYSKEVSKILRNWLKENLNNPYPSEREKNDLIKMTGLDSTQINNWFINARRRILPYMKSKFVNYDE